MLRVSHLNIYHLDNKTLDLSHFLHASSEPFHLYGITESRLHQGISDETIGIVDYDLIRRDAKHPGETGIAVYIHQSISSMTSRRHDLEHKDIDCI